MKKFLSLVLALAMTLSLVTISAGAKDFADSDELSGEQYEEAVNVMSEMGIIDGYAGGNFQPQGTLTRGAAAKIIACMMLGKTTAEALGTQAAPFKDVPAGSTFAGYIAYCVESGLIDGYADGTFRPQNTLTGFAFLKMLLTALGYDSSIEGYTGTNWTVNVMGRAQQVGLTDGNEDFVGSRAATREEACLYAVNALKATLVEYESKGTNVTVNGATVAIGASKPTYVTSNIAGAATSIDDTVDNTTHDYTVEFAEKYQPDLELDATTDAFGRPAHIWSWEGEEIGTYVDYDKLVAEYTTAVTGEDLYDLLGKAVIEDYDFNIYVDGETKESILDKFTADTYFTAGNLLRTNDEVVGDTGNGVLTEVYKDVDNEEVTIAVINTYIGVANGDYSAKKEEATFTIWGIDDAGKNQFVKRDGTHSVNLEANVEDFDVEDVADGDVVLVNVADGAIQTIADPETLSSVEISAFKKGSSLTVDGTKYSYANTASYDGEALVIYTSEDDITINLKDTNYNVFLDPYGYVIGVEENDPATNYVFITGADTKLSNRVSTTADMTAIFLDGTMDTIEVNLKKSDDLSGSGWTGSKGEDSDALINTWCTYTVNDEGVYTLKIAKDQYAWDLGAGHTKDINKKSISLKAGDGNKYVYGNDETVYLNVSLENIKTEDNNGMLTSVIGDVSPCLWA